MYIDVEHDSYANTLQLLCSDQLWGSDAPTGFDFGDADTEQNVAQLLLSMAGQPQTSITCEDDTSGCTIAVQVLRHIVNNINQESNMSVVLAYDDETTPWMTLTVIQDHLVAVMACTRMNARLYLELEAIFDGMLDGSLGILTSLSIECIERPTTPLTWVFSTPLGGDTIPNMVLELVSDLSPMIYLQRPQLIVSGMSTGPAEQMYDAVLLGNGSFEHTCHAYTVAELNTHYQRMVLVDVYPITMAGPEMFDLRSRITSAELLRGVRINCQMSILHDLVLEQGMYTEGDLTSIRKAIDTHLDCIILYNIIAFFSTIRNAEEAIQSLAAVRHDNTLLRKMRCTCRQGVLPHDNDDVWTEVLRVDLSFNVKTIRQETCAMLRSPEIIPNFIRRLSSVTHVHISSAKILRAVDAIAQANYPVVLHPSYIVDCHRLQRS
jgi:hypothetical protein